MDRPWAHQSPDTRLRHLKYARDREDERTARLDEEDVKRLDGVQRELQREQERAAGLDEEEVRRSDTIFQDMEREQQRGADLDRDSVQERIRFEQARARQLDAVPGGPQYEPGGRMPIGLGQQERRQAEERRQEGLERFREVERRIPLSSAEARRVLRPYLERGMDLKEAANWALSEQPVRDRGVQDILNTIIEGAPAGGISGAPLPGALGKIPAIQPIPTDTPFHLAAATSITRPLLPESVTETLGQTPVIGPGVELAAEGVSTPLGLAATAAWPVQAAIGIPGGIATRAAAERAGVPEKYGWIPQVAGEVMTPGAGVVPLAAATKPVRAGLRGGQQFVETVAPPVSRVRGGISRGFAEEAQGLGPHVSRADPSPPRRPPTRPRGPTPDDPEFNDIQRVALKGEKPAVTLMRRHDAAINTERQLARIEVEDANTLLREAEMGQSYKGTVVPRAGQVDEFDELYRYLHNSSKVESGEMVVPARMRPAYDKIREGVDLEQAARVDFDPEMALVEDYMYRGWKPPEDMFTGTGARGALGRKPGFKLPRVDATYDEMRAAGFEPLFWNPAEQARYSRMMGVKYREQMRLVEDLKARELALPHEGGPIPKGWRVPRVGPAFEGKPFAKGDEVMFTRRWVVPDPLANRLENAYGVTPDLGTVEAFGKTVDLMKAIDALVFIPKRAKLVGSVFQHVDFLNRSYMGAWTGFVDALSHGQPIAAVGHLAKWPKSAIDIVWATMSPGYRQGLRRMAVDTTPLFKDRNLSMRMISEAGLSQRDVTILPNIDQIAREAAQEAAAVKGVKAPFRLAADVERLHRQGLFQGLYPAAILTDVKNNIAPMFVRGSPKATDAQLAGEIAKFANTRYSVIPASMSVVQNRAARGFLTRLFFSMGEQEGLLRLFTGALWGPNTSYYRKNWLGAYLGLMAMANTIHFASTGEPLPWARWSPISKNKWGPLPFGYNRDFAAPNIPLTGRSGTQLTLDLVGQLDTAFRLLDPASFLAARESVPVRAGLNQITGKDFFGAPIDTVGPGGVVSRTSQLVSDMFAPIGIGQAALQLARSNIQGAEGIIQPGEDRLGAAGVGVQATGINVRAETTPQLLDRIRADVMREKGIEGRYEDIKATDSPLAKEIDDEVESRIGQELELRRETAELRGQTTPQSQFYEEQEISRAQQNEEQLADDAKLNSGQWQGDVWRDRLRDRQKASFNQREGLKQALKIEFAEKEAPSGSVNAVIDAYFDINVDDYLQEDGTIDWGGFFDAQDTALSPLSPKDKKRVEGFIHQYDTPTVEEFRKAQEVVDEFYDKPKYEGLSVEEGERLDEFINVTVEEFQRRRLRETGSTFRTRIAIIVAAEESGLPEKLLNVALLLQRERFEKLIVNPERDEWLAKNDRILGKFYPDLLERELSRAQEAELGEEAFEAIATR